MTAAERRASAPAAAMRSTAPTPKSQRTRARILETSRQLFLERGFAGTSIEDITQGAGLSRASFWTYFPTKLDVLRALGSDIEDAGFALAAVFRNLPKEASAEVIAGWVRLYLAFLDEHGAFLHAAFQAAYDDPETRAWGLSVELLGAEEIGRGLVRLRGGAKPTGRQATAEGLAILSMLERFWYAWRVAGAPFDEETVVVSISHIIWGTGRR